MPIGVCQRATSALTSSPETWPSRPHGTARSASPRHGPATHSPPCSSKLAPCAAHTSRPSLLLRNWPGAQSSRRPACGQMLSQARTLSPSRWRISDSASPSSVASTSAKPPSAMLVEARATLRRGVARPRSHCLTKFSHASGHRWPDTPLPRRVPHCVTTTATANVSPRRFRFDQFTAFRNAFAPRKPRHRAAARRRSACVGVGAAGRAGDVRRVRRRRR